MSGSAISLNSSGDLYTTLFKKISKRSPGFHTKKFVNKLKGIKSKKRLSYKKKPRKIQNVLQNDNTVDEYGPDAHVLDISNDEFDRTKETFLKELKKTEEEILSIANNTILQAHCVLWLEERRKRITASSFGKVCKLKSSTDPKKTVNLLLNGFAGM